MQIGYVDGPRLRRGIIAGARRVIQMQEALNRINVFPVPDNDTGTNMALTMQSVAEGVIDCRNPSVSEISRAAADSALMGARGNSGAILAQFFDGLAGGLRNEVKIQAHRFAAASIRAANAAHDAIAAPREGTILTVIRDWAQQLHKQRNVGDFVELFGGALQKARESLSRTPEMLQILAQSGVVDAGAQGFVHLLEGIGHLIDSGNIERFGANQGSLPAPRIKQASRSLEYRYCTECLVEGEEIERTSLRTKLAELGDSLIVAGSSSRLRVHVHTNDPARVFSVAGEYGAIVQKKTDDMFDQRTISKGRVSPHTIAIVTDSACDLPSDFLIRHNIQMVPVQVSFGHDRYIDKVTITPKKFYRILEESPFHPKTSQPAPGDYLRIYEDLAERYECIVSIHLSGRLSGTLQAAQTAASQMKGVDIRVVDSGSASIALGLVVAEAARALEEGNDVEEVVSRTQSAARNAKLYVSVATMEYLVRGGRVSRTRGLMANLLGLRPIITIDPSGRVAAIAKTRGGSSSRRKIMDLIQRDVLGKRNVRFAVAHANAQETALCYADDLRNRFEAKDIMFVEASPALGAHAGPGAVGVALLCRPAMS